MLKTKPLTDRDIELRRWCIDMAARWPVVRVESRYGNGMAGIQPGYFPNSPGGDAEADLIGRATKIEAWLKRSAN